MDAVIVFFVLVCVDRFKDGWYTSSPVQIPSWLRVQLHTCETKFMNILCMNIPSITVTTKIDKKNPAHLHVGLGVLPGLSIEEGRGEERRRLRVGLVVHDAASGLLADPHVPGGAQVGHVRNCALRVDLPDAVQLVVEVGTALGAEIDAVNVEDRPAHWDPLILGTCCTLGRTGTCCYIDSVVDA